MKLRLTLAAVKEVNNIPFIQDHMYRITLGLINNKFQSVIVINSNVSTRYGTPNKNNISAYLNERSPFRKKVVYILL